MGLHVGYMGYIGLHLGCIGLHVGCIGYMGYMGLHVGCMGLHVGYTRVTWGYMWVTWAAIGVTWSCIWVAFVGCGVHLTYGLHGVTYGQVTCVTCGLHGLRDTGLITEVGPSMHGGPGTMQAAKAGWRRAEVVEPPGAVAPYELYRC
jgi:hypothetical protein